MNLQYLKYFRSLAHYEHYSKASEELGIAQSSLSHAITVLENELGVYLFEKEGRNVKLTKYGKQYLKYVENALDILEEGARQMKNAACASSITIEIGFISSVQQYLIESIHQFNQKFPQYDCHFSLHEGITYSLLEDLKRDKLDLILASQPAINSEYEAIPIIKQDIVVIVAKNHPLTKMKKIEPAQLISVPLILHTTDSGMRGIVDNILRDNGVHPIISGEATDDRNIVSMVSLGLGAAFVTDSEAIHKQGISILPLDYEYNYRYVNLIYKKNHYNNPVIQNFIKFIEEFMN